MVVPAKSYDKHFKSKSSVASFVRSSCSAIEKKKRLNGTYFNTCTVYSVPISNGMDLVIKLFNSSNAFLKISYNCVSLTPAAV